MLFILLKRFILKLGRLFSPHKKAIKRINQKRLEKIRDLKIMMSKEAIRTIKNNMTLKNKTVSLKVIGDYNQLISMLNQERIGGKSRESVHFEKVLLYKAVQAERDEVQALFEKGDITRDVANKLRKQINLRESMSLEESGH